MIDVLIKAFKALFNRQAHSGQLRDSAESECQAMVCGEYNPRLLAKMKRCNASHE